MTGRPPRGSEPPATQTAAHKAGYDWSGTRGEKWRAKLGGMEGMLAPVDEPLIHALQVSAPCRIADVGCGGGGTSPKILRGAPKGGVVHGFDISPALVELARERAQRDELAAIFEVSTAAPPEEAYDRLVSRFGVVRRSASVHLVTDVRRQ